jgi:multisubunit Na+/H+ antiporter MnhC subunit
MHALLRSDSQTRFEQDLLPQLGHINTPQASFDPIVRALVLTALSGRRLVEVSRRR